jgi:hypothetical protein
LILVTHKRTVPNAFGPGKREPSTVPCADGILMLISSFAFMTG